METPLNTNDPKGLVRFLLIIIVVAVILGGIAERFHLPQAEGPKYPTDEEAAHMTPREFAEKFEEARRYECDQLYAKRSEDLTAEEREKRGVCIIVANPHTSPWDLK